MSQWKKKEKCKDEPEINGSQQCGATSPAAGRCQQKQGRDGRKSPQPGNQRDNPKEGWAAPKNRRKGPKPTWAPKGGKNGPTRGGDKAVAAAAADATSQALGLKDALREQAEETRVQEDTNRNLRRENFQILEDLKEKEKALGLRRNQVDDYHLDTRKNFACKWADETPRAWALFVLLVFLVPLSIVALAFYLELEEILIQWQLWLLFVLYEGDAIIFDRYVSTKRGYRAIFSARATHSYSSVELVDWDLDDRRAAAMSLGEMKYADAKYGLVQYNHTLNGRNVRRDTFGKLAKADTMLMSYKLLSQLTTPMIMLARDQETAWDRMECSAKAMHAVNIDSELFTDGKDVVGNTLQIAHGLWLQSRQAKLGHFRPAPAK